MTQRITKIGNKRVLLSQNFLIPKGEFASTDIDLELPPNELKTEGATFKTPSINTSLHIEINAEHFPSESDKGQIKWKFETDPKPIWTVTFHGPFHGMNAATTEFSDFAALGGKKLGFWASFYGTPHLCEVQLQLMIEE